MCYVILTNYDAQLLPSASYLVSLAEDLLALLLQLGMCHRQTRAGTTGTASLSMADRRTVGVDGALEVSALPLTFSGFS
jgi:hypothetical protein